MKTQFFRVASSGKTIDGRTITPAQIDQMAASYDPKKYTARVNLEHLRSLLPDNPFRAYGDVLALKAEDGEAGSRVLLAQIDATEDLMALAAARQKVFWSIELADNFAGSGQAYMVGLAATDSPASLFTEVMKFAAGHEKAPAALKEHLFSVQLEGPAPVAESDPADKPGLFAKVKELLAGKTSGDNARFAQLETAMTEIAKAVGELKDASAAPPPAADPAVAQLAADFAALKTTLETTSPTLFRKPTGGDGSSATATDC